jgi:hypothetical protein
MAALSLKVLAKSERTESGDDTNGQEKAVRAGLGC